MVSNKTIQTESNVCKMKGSGYCPKPLEIASAFLSKKWTISIVITIGNFKQVRFNDILNRVSGISPKTLTERLRELGQEGLIKRAVFAEIPPRVEYSLTAKGKKLMKALIPLIKWAES